MMKTLFFSALLILWWPQAIAATQPPQLPDYPLRFNWAVIERDPAPICAAPDLLASLHTSRERCEVAALLTIDRLNAEVALMTRGRQIGWAELADLRQYIVGHFASLLRLHLAAATAPAH